VARVPGPVMGVFQDIELTTYQFASNLGITVFQPILCACKSNT